MDNNEQEVKDFIKLKNNQENKNDLYKLNIKNVLNYNSPLESLKSQLNNYNFSETIVKSVIPSLNSFSTLIGQIAKHQISLFNSEIIEAMTNPMIKIIKQIADSQRILMNNIIETITFSPLFESLSKTLEEIKANPNSVVSWLNYYDKLSEFFWIMPYQMTSEELHTILSTIKTEKEFDRYIVKYFNKYRVNSLIEDIKRMLKRKQDIKLFEQIIFAYNNKCYSLASMGLISIIDNLLSYYLINKGCTSRIKLFEPIINDMEDKQGLSDDFSFIIMMINSNINLLYEEIEFNEKIKIKTNKKARRNPVSHGKSYSNKKIDTIMLLNTIYYLLIAQNELSNYKNSICYDRKKKQFYLPDKKKKQEIKKQIKENIVKSKEQVK